MSKSLARVPIERIEKAILLVRGEKVMLDRDLAALYEIPTKALKQAVRRNIVRFPEDFMFVLDKTEFEAWRSQFVTSKSGSKGASLSTHGIHRTRRRHVIERLK